MSALAHSQRQQKTRVCLNYIEASLTIAMERMDVDIGLLVNLRRFIDKHSIVGLCSVERGGVLTHNLF